MSLQIPSEETETETQLLARDELSADRHFSAYRVRGKWLRTERGSVHRLRTAEAVLRRDGVHQHRQGTDKVTLSSLLSSFSFQVQVLIAAGVEDTQVVQVSG